VDVADLKARLREASPIRATGRVVSVTGLSMRCAMPGVRIGDVLLVQRRSGELACEVVGFDGAHAVTMPLGALTGVGPDDIVVSTGAGFQVRVHASLLGRVVDGLGRPIDGGPELTQYDWVPTDRDPPPALTRKPVALPLATGVRVLDGLLTLGEGQRIGLFAGSGVGKSTLLGAVARGTAADIVICGLVGERGREVGEFLEHALGETGRKRSIVVCATSDTPALERLRSAQVATAYAEYFRDQGAKVLLLLDSVTRFARAQREVGLAAGEPPARRGYPPSVFAMLPRLLERAGQSAFGSITAIYTVLIEGSDMEEPIADEVRGILDGHVVLDRTLAARGRYPAVDVGVSLSRVMDAVVTHAHREAARKFRRLLSAYESKRDLITLGAYAKGSDPEVDEAIAKLTKLEGYLRQDANVALGFNTCLEDLIRAVS
jgi:ATP synthase in type III secretion protein N